MSATAGKVNVLVLGGGGREHALAWAVAKSPRCGELVVAPGNAGTPGRRESVTVDNPEEVCALAKRLGTDLVIIGPDAAIAAGVADALANVGIMVFGATQAASQLEWSKSWAREFCERHGIAGPRSASFTTSQLDDALAYAKTAGAPLVVKADGLAAGKGVVVPTSVDDTLDAIRATLGGSASRIVLEELLVGEEVSVLAFTDGTTVAVMPPAQDHKRIGEGDRGANTGGMGAYAPAPGCPPALLDTIRAEVLQRAVDGCRAEGRPYVGVLYAGMMLTAAGPRVLEFNCRFGDPETQVILPLLTSDLIDVAIACATGTLSTSVPEWSTDTACTVVLASEGYPNKPRTGDVITLGTPANDSGADTMVFHAGTELVDAELRTAGGRVLSVTGVGSNIAEARMRAYDRAALVSFAGRQMRRDIAWRALAGTTGGYAASGVDISEGNRAVDLLKASVTSTHGPAVLAGVGAFGGVFDASIFKTMDNPVLVASTDGVGTKVALAAQAGRLRGVGIDLVNHCINDVLVQNARPLFFLDYIASSKILGEQVAEIVSGMSEACVASGCALLGGETAEMPGVYHAGHVDVAGTLVGIAERSAILPTDNIAAGDVLIGMASSGPHTSGYSLLRKMFAGLPLDAMPEPLEVPIGDALLEPHRSYVPPLTALLDGEHRTKVKALVHITGGGLLENIPRVLPSGIGADVRIGSWPVPPLFRLIRDSSGLPTDELHRTLNMGVGMVIICAPSDVASVQSTIAEDTWVIGELVAEHGGEVVLRGSNTQGSNTQGLNPQGLNPRGSNPHSSNVEGS